MGMRLCYVSIPDGDIGRLRTDPRLAAALLVGGGAGPFGGLDDDGGSDDRDDFDDDDEAPPRIPPGALTEQQKQMLRASGLPGISRLLGESQPRLRLVRPEDFDDDQSEDGSDAAPPAAAGDDDHDAADDRSAKDDSPGQSASGVADRGRSGGDGPGESGGPVRGDLEKAWHGLHFVLTGRAAEAPAPFGYLLSGGTEVGGDMGYGPARVLRPAEVRQFRDALGQVSDAEFDRRFDLAALARNAIYPGVWDEDRDELLEEYMMYFQQLKRDLNRVVAAGDGLLIALT